ncbi:MAG: hypothetical protein ACRDZ0_07800 [Acidimicrobiales bacterium]
MNDLLSPDDVEDRLRRTLAARAEDMVPGDGSGWDLAAPGPARTRWPDADATSAPSPSRGRRELGAAAAALIIGVGGAVAIALTRDDDRDRVASQDPTTTGTPTTATSTAPSDEPARPQYDFAYPIGEYEGEGYRIHAQFEDGVTTDLVPPTSIWQRVRVGDHEGYYAALSNGAISELWVVFEDGVAVLRDGSLPRERLIAAGATVTRDPGTGLYTMPAPPGWATLWTTPPDWNTPVSGANGAADVVHLGRFVSTADPGGTNFGAAWYPGWNESNVPQGAEPVQIGDDQGYLGTIAPEAGDLFQLWMVYEDGVVELQAAGMSRDQLIAAGDGVERGPGTEEFTITPPPGFEPES